MIIRLASCLSCHTHSYRAMRGCTSCAIHAVKRFDGTDTELVNLYREALAEIQTHFALA
jgi:hypothetical protein